MRQIRGCASPSAPRPRSRATRRRGTGLASGSACALSLGLTGALLLSAHEQARVDVQLECNGPLKGMLVDADETGAVRGLVRAGGLRGQPAPAESSRFDPRPLLATAHDERAGMLSVLRAPAQGTAAHRAAFPFAGADLGAALTLFLRGERALGGELSLEVLTRAGEPIAAVAGALVAPLYEENAERARALGKPLRQGGLREALLREQEAAALARQIAREFSLGALRRDRASSSPATPAAARASGWRARCAPWARRSCGRWRKRTAARRSPAISATRRTSSPRRSFSRWLRAEDAP